MIDTADAEKGFPSRCGLRVDAAGGSAAPSLNVKLQAAFSISSPSCKTRGRARTFPIQQVQVSSQSRWGQGA